MSIPPTRAQLAVANAPGSRPEPSRLLGALLVLAFFLPAAVAAEVVAEPEPGVDGPAPSTAEVDADPLFEIRRQIREAEYHVTWAVRTKLADLDAAWQAPNRAHDLRTYFTPDGVRVVRRTEEAPSWEWGLELVGYGRGEQVRAVEAASLVPQDKRIRYDRGSLVEWYVNDRRGLEQGFTLHVPPREMPGRAAGSGVPAILSRRAARREGPSEASPVYLVLELRSDLTAVLSADGQAIDFHRGEGFQLLHYGQLVVRDATERDLPAWMETFRAGSARGIRLVFDDRDAVYPVTVDPLLTSPAWTNEGNQSGAEFGVVAGAGDINGDGYDDVIVGAPLYDKGQTDEGRVFVYHGSASGLSPLPVWTAEGDLDGAQLGYSVAGAGDVQSDGWDDVLVGAPFYDDGVHDGGMAFAYHGSDGGLDLVGEGTIDGGPCPIAADWCAASDQAGSQFGSSVAGVGYVNEDVIDPERFADVIVGAPYYDADGPNTGRGFVYHGSATGLEETEAVRIGGTGDNDHQGLGPGSLAGAGDVNDDGYDDIISGRPHFGNDDCGRADVWYGSATGVPASSGWGDAWGCQDWGIVGAAVAGGCDVNGDGIDDILIAAPYWDASGGSDEGGVRVYHGVHLSNPVEARRLYAGIPDALFGYSVDCAGDVNGDGYDDVIVGAPRYDSPEVDEGRALLFYGSATGVAASPAWTAESDQADAEFGSSVAGAGNINGDGCCDDDTDGTCDRACDEESTCNCLGIWHDYDDVVIGAHWYDGDKPDEGAAYAYHGVPDPEARDLAQHLGLAEAHIEDAFSEVLSDGSPVPGFEDLGGNPGVGRGPKPESVLISTGLAQDEGLGDTDWGADGLADTNRFSMTLNVPPGKNTFRFTTQFITSELEITRQNYDSVRIQYVYDGNIGTCTDDVCNGGPRPDEPCTSEHDCMLFMDLFGIVDFSSGAFNPPVSHAIRVTGKTTLRVDFEVRDFNEPPGDGDHDSALLVSRVFFSDLDLPPEATGDYLENPAPSDVSLTAGTYTYAKTLFSAPGKGMPFSFRILYNSASVHDGPLGPKWSHNFESSIRKVPVWVEGHICISGPFYCFPIGTGEELNHLVVSKTEGGSEYFVGGGEAHCRENTETACDEFPYDEDCPFCSVFPPSFCICDPLEFVPKFPGVYSKVVENNNPTDYTYTTKEHLTYDYTWEKSDNPDLYLLGTITDSNANTIVLHYDPEDKLDFVQDTRERIFVLNYDGEGRLTSLEYPEEDVGWPSVTLGYDEATGLLTSVTDANGHTTTFGYDGEAEGYLTSVTDDDGVTFVTNDYEAYEAIGVRQTGNRVVVRREANDPSGPLDEWACPDDPHAADDPDDPLPYLCYGRESLISNDRLEGRVEQQYDVKERLSKRETLLGFDENGNPCTWGTAGCMARTHHEYDANDNPVLERNLVSDDGTQVTVESQMTYDPDRGNLETRVTRVCADGDDAGNPCVSDTECTGGSCGLRATMAYDAADNLTHRAVHPPGVDFGYCGDPPDPSLCYVEEFQYYQDGTNNLWRRVNPEGDTHSYDYNNGDGQVTSATNPRNRVTSFDYDPEGMLTDITVPCELPGAAVCTSTYEYDSLGRRTKTIDPRGNETTFEYDAGGRLVSETAHTAAATYTTTYAYDARDRVTTVTDASGTFIGYDYTATGRLLRIHDALHPGQGPFLVAYGYDADDRNVAVTDAGGYQTWYNCDAADRLVGVAAPIAPATSTPPATFGAASATYDAGGRVTSITDPRGETTAYEHDALGRLTREIDPLLYEVTTAYNDRGLPASVTNARGETVSYDYDRAGRLTLIGLPGGDITHTLDANGNRENTADPRVGPIGRTFDGLDRIVVRSDPFGNEIAYEYDAAGNLVKLCYDGPACLETDAVAYTYDELNRLVTVCDWSCDPVHCDPDVPDLTGCTAAYAYDEVGNLTAAWLPDGSGISYTYDVTHRLTGITGPVYQVTYTLNASGQRVAASETLPFDPKPDELVTPLGQHETANRIPGFGYDADGNLTAWPDRFTSLTYDALNQLTQVQEVGGGATDYRYDADGLRVEAVRPGDTTRDTTRYVYDPTAPYPRLLEEWDDADNLIARYVYGLGLISRVDDQLNVRVYHFNGQGSTVALTDTGGSVTDAYAYTPYGLKTVDPTYATNATPNPFTYHGQYGAFDEENGLYFMGSRYYAAELMRFVQKDRAYTGSLEDPQSLNRYAFVRGDPIRQIDPNGEFLNVVMGAVAGAGLQMAANLLSGEDLMEGVWGAALEGAIVAAFPAGGFGVGAAASLAGEGLNQVVAGEFSAERLVLAGALGGVFGAAGKGVGDDLAEAAARRAARSAGTKKFVAQHSDDLVGSMIPPGQRADFLAHLSRQLSAKSARKTTAFAVEKTFQFSKNLVSLQTSPSGTSDPAPLPVNQTPVPPSPATSPETPEGERSDPPRPCR